MRLAEPFTDRVTGLAIEVHRRTAGLLESVYAQCLNFNMPRLMGGLCRTVVQLPSKPTASAPCSPCSPRCLRAEKTWPRFAPVMAGGRHRQPNAAAPTAFATRAKNFAPQMHARARRCSRRHSRHLTARRHGPTRPARHHPGRTKRQRRTGHPRNPARAPPSLPPAGTAASARKSMIWQHFIRGSQAQCG